MYALLCGAISDAIDSLPLNEENFCGIQILRRSLTKAEEMYIAAADVCEVADIEYDATT